MSALTPGPWAAFEADGHTNIIALMERTRVVFSLPGRSKREPDVRLATAAPDLLAACEALSAALKHVTDASVPNIEHGKALLAAAIRKARGQ